MVSARWVHYAQFIEAVQLWLERPRLSGGRPRAATIFGIAAARRGGEGRAAVVARLALSYCAVTCVGRGRFSFRVVGGRAHPRAGPSARAGGLGPRCRERDRLSAGRRRRTHALSIRHRTTP